MPDEKMIRLIKRLREKTIAGAWNWNETVDPNTYTTSFPNYSAQIEYIKTEKSEIFTFSILDSTGRTVEEVNDYDLTSEDLDNKDPEQFFREFYLSARKSGVGVEKALDSILENLDRE